MYLVICMDDLKSWVNFYSSQQNGINGYDKSKSSVIWHVKLFKSRCILKIKSYGGMITHLGHEILISEVDVTFLDIESSE